MVLLASGVFPLVGEVDPGACAGLLLGETAACPPVCGSGSCLSFGRAVSKGVFGGSCWLRETFGQPACS